MLPLVEIAIEPKSTADQDKLSSALIEMVAGDPFFGFYTDEESGLTVLTGVSETHLDVKVDSLRSLYQIDCPIGAPQVAYRETISQETEIDSTYKTLTGGAGQFARVTIRFEPGNPGSGFGGAKALITCTARRLVAPEIGVTDNKAERWISKRQALLGFVIELACCRRRL